MLKLLVLFTAVAYGSAFSFGLFQNQQVRSPSFQINVPTSSQILSQVANLQQAAQPIQQFLTQLQSQIPSQSTTLQNINTEFQSILNSISSQQQPDASTVQQLTQNVQSLISAIYQQQINVQIPAQLQSIVNQILSIQNNYHSRSSANGCPPGCVPMYKDTYPGFPYQCPPGCVLEL